MTSLQDQFVGHQVYNSQHKSVDLPPLTKNQKMVYATLLGLGRPAKAYDLLDILRVKGVKAAPTVYRALHGLQEKGLVQHLVSNSSFIALESLQRQESQNVMFVCEECGAAVATEGRELVSVLNSNADDAGFNVRSYHLELFTSCSGCDGKVAASR